MFDFETIAEISFAVNHLEQKLILENGRVISRENIREFFSLTFDA